ncbi:MAG: carboxypeptidase-like regulatory domain-containing protein [Sphingobacteriales bacterium]|nr:MAG: carboxypeptidase-like regulatory domain-containing protein [Sphingobacteriales bacterium]
MGRGTLHSNNIKMKAVFLLMTFLTLQMAAYAGKIKGKVSDERTGETIIGATVVIKGSSNGTATDVDGNFELTATQGEYTLQVKYIGYQAKDVSGVKISGNEAIQVDITLAEAKSTQHRVPEKHEHCGAGCICRSH